MDRLAQRPVFSADDRTYTWEDVVICAYVTGVIAGLEKHTARAIAAERHLGDIGRQLSAADVEEAAAAWRYERDLIAADDLEAWVMARALTLDEWSAYIQRTAAMTRWSGRIAKRNAPRPAEITEVLFAEAMCSGTITEVVDWLAGRAAVFDRVGSERAIRSPAPAAIRAAVDRMPASVRRHGLFGSSGAECAKRAAHIATMDIVYRRFVKTLAGDALQREIEAHALDWTRVEAQTLRFDTEEPAREAVLLIQTDGVPIAEVAKLARTAVIERSHVLEDVAGPMRHRLVSAQPGELLGPWPDERDGFSVLLVTDRVAPSAQEREIRTRAQGRVERRIVAAEVEKRIHWHERF